MVIHRHKYGSSVGLILAIDEPSEEKACEVLDFDWETDPLFEESVEVFEVHPKDAVEI